MTILSPHLALNLNYLLLCHIAFCRAARATPCHTTPPLSCQATVSLLALHLSCAGWLLHRLLSRCATISLAPAICWIATSLPALPPLFITLCVAPLTSSLPPHSVRRHRTATTVVMATTAVWADGSSSSSRPHPCRWCRRHWRQLLHLCFHKRGHTFFLKLLQNL